MKTIAALRFSILTVALALLAPVAVMLLKGTTDIPAASASAEPEASLESN